MYYEMRFGNTVDDEKENREVKDDVDGYVLCFHAGRTTNPLQEVERDNAG
jgi:hypothetical protein